MQNKVFYTAVCVLLFFSFAAEALSDANQIDYETLLKEKASLIVTVRFVVKMEFSFGGRGGEREASREIQGVVVHPDGLIMVSLSSLSPDAGRRQRGGRRGEQERGGMRSTPSNIKVVFENDEREYDAIVGATDSKLDLAFLLTKNLEERKISAVDFNRRGNIQVGGEYIGVSRLSKGFDYAPFWGSIRVTGKVKVPRPLWSVTDTFNRARGLPLFDHTGIAVGVLTRQQSAAASTEAGGGRIGGMRGTTGGRGGDLFLLPAETLATIVPHALANAKKSLQKASEEE